MSTLGIGLIGTGRHGARYAQHICQDIEGLHLVAITRRDRNAAAQQAEEYGCRAYADYREMLAAPDVDAVIVVVPPTLHGDIIEAAAAENVVRTPVGASENALTHVAIASIIGKRGIVR